MSTPDHWLREVITVHAATDANGVAINRIEFCGRIFSTAGTHDTSTYKSLRALLDTIYERADKYPDLKHPELDLPKVVIEIRADGDASYRVVGELEEVLTDAIDLDTMRARPANIVRRPFVHLDFTTRLPQDT